VTLFGLGAVGQFCTRIAKHRGARVIGVDSVPERREMTRRHGIEVLDPGGADDVPGAGRETRSSRRSRTVLSRPSCRRGRG
jgi:hypothetical protein